ncbi:MAG: hypothetical protein ACRDGT_03645 [Candidatus Limnocylindria bacterium]
MRTGDARIALVLAALAAAAYVAFGWGEETAHDHHGRLAAAFLEGRWWLVEPPSWLSGLVPCGPSAGPLPDRWCVVHPPLPAVLSVPFLVSGSTALAQGLMAQIAGGASAGPLYLGLRAFGTPRWVALAGVVLSAFGTTLLFSSADARAPFAAHSVAMLFGSIAFAAAARGGPPWLVGAAIGLGALARLPVAAAAPALALLAARKAGVPFAPVLARVILAGLPFALVYLGYDLLRWGSVTDTGYTRLIQGDVFFSHGLFSPAYLPRQLEAIFLEPPDIVEATPWFLRPRFIGMGLFFTTPAFVWAFAALRAVRRDAAIAATALAAVLVLLPGLLYGSVGQPQFGYRYSIDAQPFLVALACAGAALVGGVWRRRPSLLFLAAVTLSVVLNVAATIAILRFGYWQ